MNIRSGFGVALTTALLFFVHAAMAQPDARPWAPSADCKIAARDATTLYPEALAALGRAATDHRVTQALNLSKAASNYHGPDGKLNGQPVTGAVDLSVRCLTQTDIRSLLSMLTDEGYVAWYRHSGEDGWVGASHIHAVWVKERLKPQLRRQVQSWTEGRTGLVGDARYGFWQPTPAQRAIVVELQNRAVAGDKPRTKKEAA